MNINMNTAKNISYYSNLLKLIKKSKEPDRNIILKHLDIESTDFLCEVIYNVIGGTVELSKRQIKKLRNQLMHNKKCFRYLSKNSGNLQRKRKLIKQNGKGIGMILSIALPIILRIVEGILKPSK